MFFLLNSGLSFPFKELLATFLVRHVVCVCMHAKSLQSYATLYNPMDCSPPGSSVLGILQTRILEWIAMPSSKGSSLQCLLHWQASSLPLEPPGKHEGMSRGDKFPEFCLSGKVFILFHH